MGRLGVQRKRPGVTRMTSSFVSGARAAVPILCIVFAGSAFILPVHGPLLSMKILKILAYVVAALVGLTIFGKVRQKMALNAPAKTAAKAGAETKNPKDPGLSPAGFFLLSRDDAGNPRVTIITDPNCTSSEGLRARNLETLLQDAGIPTETKQGIEFQFNDPDDMARVQKYASVITNPLVLVRGWAKCNPLPQEIIDQYHSGL
jgi:hypothetical protein